MKNKGETREEEEKYKEREGNPAKNKRRQRTKESPRKGKPGARSMQGRGGGRCSEESDP